MIDPHALELTSLILFVPLVLLGLARRKRRPLFTGGHFDRIASRRRLAVLSVGVAALAVRATLLPLHPPPEPGVVDEYSYLLAGDTFASGRAVNPAHPLWIHFETICEMVQPRYASKYPPAQGLVLAAGILLAHSAWVGVWLSVAVMCASMVWMLQGWVPPRWALLGGILIVLRIAAASYWVDSYWGGAVAATGGALVYGALPRLMRRANRRDGVILCAGLAILANSRPFEGLVVAAPALTALAVWAFRRGWPEAQVLLPGLAVLVVTAAGMLGYNRAVTGNVWQLPYQAHEAQYAVAPMFWFQELRPAPVYHHADLKGFWTDWAVYEYGKTTREGVIAASVSKIERVRGFFLGPLLTLPLLALPWACRQKRFRLIYVSLGIFLFGLLAVIDILPHYAAPATALIYLTVVQCLRYFRTGGTACRIVARNLPLVLACTVVAFYSLEASGFTFLPDHYSWCFATPGNLERARLLKQLESTPGRHLVMVRYAADHRPDWEWIYNRADIDGAKVVWAHEMDEGRNRALREYFSARQVWLLEPDAKHPILQPYGERLGKLSPIDRR